MSSTLLKIATVAITGAVLFAATTDADARGGGHGGGRGSPGGVSVRDHRGGPTNAGLVVRDHRDSRPVVRDHRDGRPIVRDHRDGRPLVRDHRAIPPIVGPIGPIRPPGVRPPSVRPPIVNPPIVTQPPRGPGVIVDPIRPPRPPHGHGYRRFAFAGGDLVPGCAVESRRVYDEATGQLVRRRVVLCPEY